MDNVSFNTYRQPLVPYWDAMTAPVLDVLVVEDDAKARTLVCDMLTTLRQNVHAVSTAEEGLALLRKQRFDLLLADIDLPGVSGVELARAAVEILPSLKVIFVSGYGYLVADNDRINFDFLLLAKP